ncbi:hypothetical protein V5N11_024835 [Cardamine amara subsp. amara]|uniref:Sel1-like protein n=1 Tax=Cardamine amara subsp. amara TaxID=228776 RepID=A0ABD1ADZ4_CARAN
MGKSIVSTVRFAELAIKLSSENPTRPHRPTPRNKVFVKKTRETQVVEDCVRRWFQDTLKEAKSGDVGMQVLVGQMYCSGYGIPKDEHKGRAWINKASRTRSSAWQVSDKPPGYNASDSDSNDKKD